MSFGELFRQSGQVANALVAMGVKPGDRVAVQVEKSVSALVLYLAVLRAGAVFLPLNTSYTLNELTYFVGDAEPTVIVCDPSVECQLVLLPGLRGVIKTLDARGSGTLTTASSSLNDEFATVTRDADDLAAILYTSGTTGRAKGAMLSHGNLISNAETLRELWRFQADDVLLHALPIYHAHGLFVASNVALLAGASMWFLPRFSPDAVIDAMAHSTVMMGVPTHYVRLLKHPRLRQSVQSVRLFISGSAPLLPATHIEWATATGHAILERYGMTETCMLTSNPYEGDRIPGSVGPAIPGVELRVVDLDTGSPLDRNEIGMIEVKGPNVFRGYWRRPEITAKEFRAEGYFVTGDLGKIDERGYLRIVGRDKDLVITGGLNVYPREVEAEIDAIPDVAESAVIGIEHPDFGEGVTAVIVPANGASLNEAEVLARLEGRLSNFKKPKRMLFVNELPRNAMGKVQKNVLRERYKHLYTDKA